MMKRQKSLDNYRGTKAELREEVEEARRDGEVMSCVVGGASSTTIIAVRRLNLWRKVFASFSIELILVILLLMSCLLPAGLASNVLNQPDHDVILSPNPQKISSGKYAYFEPENVAANRQSRREETATRVPWEDPLKETVSLALGRNSRVSKNAIFTASYTGYNDLNAPNFGDITVLAKGKLKQHANKTFSFEQMNEKCDDKCQQNADKFLENVTALWMVERIRHRDSNEHRFDMKFTIIPINDNDEIKQQIDHNTLENRLRHQMKKSYVLRDSDYPRYFNNRRTDLFNTGFTRTLSNLMNPNNMLQTLLGFNISPLQQASLVNMVKNDQQHVPQHLKEIIKDTRLNTGEFYIGTKPKLLASLTATNNQKPNYHSSPSTNVLAAHSTGVILPPSVKFPDSQEQTSSLLLKHQQIQQLPHYMQRGQQQQQQPYPRPKPEIYHRNTNSPIDPRGAIDNILVGSDNQNYHYQQATKMQAVPLYTIPIDMNTLIHSLPAAIPLSVQFSTPTNPASLWIPQPEVTTFRYPSVQVANSVVDHNGAHHHPKQQQQQPLGVPKIPYNKNSGGERHTAVNHPYSRPDPVYHSSLSAPKTEAATSQSTRQNNYANVNSSVRQKSSHQLNKYDDNDDEFKPITPMYDVRKYKNGYRLAPVATTTPSAPASTVKATAPSPTVEQQERATILPTIIVESYEKSNEIAGYRVVSERATMTTTEKPVLKWMPKQRKTKPSNQTFVVTPANPAPTTFDQMVPIETTTQPAAAAQTTQLFVTKTQFFRGRNRFSSKRNSSATLRGASPTVPISPNAVEPITTTKLIRKKSSASTTHTPSSSLFTSSTLYPAYVTVTPIPMTDEVTLQSLSTSISYEVGGEATARGGGSEYSYEREQTTSMPGYEVIPADVVEVVHSNSTNMKLFKVGASDVVPDKLDDLTISILNHAKALEKNESSSSGSSNSSSDDDDDKSSKKV